MTKSGHVNREERMPVLAGKVAIVTGASSTGIGGAIARSFARHGATLFLTSSEDETDRDQVVSECRSISPVESDVRCFVYDFLEDRSAETMVADAARLFGRVDLLVNNAAVRNRKPFGTYSGSEFDQLIAANIRAPFLASQAVLPLMRSQGGGRIIHIASQLGLVTATNQSLYSLTKAALISLTRSMALELAADGIIVNAVSPGPIATGYQERSLRGHSDQLAAMLAKVPVGRSGTPDEVAEVVQFLATCEGTFIQGHNLVVDGGYILQ
jgi:NAD(P)-dependent dehydrogenase (short-subunit alcohol dehydrogenase family)